MAFVDETVPEADVLVPLDEVRRRHVTKVLEACGGNRTNAARILHLDRKTLYRKLVRWGLTGSSATSAK